MSYMSLYIYIYICLYISLPRLRKQNDRAVGRPASKLILSTGITQQIFDTLSTALKCIHFMETNELYSLMSDVSLETTKTGS